FRHIGGSNFTNHLIPTPFCLRAEALLVSSSDIARGTPVRTEIPPALRLLPPRCRILHDVRLSDGVGCDGDRGTVRREGPPARQQQSLCHHGPVACRHHDGERTGIGTTAAAEAQYLVHHGQRHRLDAAEYLSSRPHGWGNPEHRPDWAR